MIEPLERLQISRNVGEDSNIEVDLAALRDKLNEVIAFISLKPYLNEGFVGSGAVSPLRESLGTLIQDISAIAVYAASIADPEAHEIAPRINRAIERALRTAI